MCGVYCPRTKISSLLPGFKHFLVFNLNHGGHIGNALRNTPPNRTAIYINIDILTGVLYHPHCPPLRVLCLPAAFVRL